MKKILIFFLAFFIIWFTNTSWNYSLPSQTEVLEIEKTYPVFTNKIQNVFFQLDYNQLLKIEQLLEQIISDDARIDYIRLYTEAFLSPSWSNWLLCSESWDFQNCWYDYPSPPLLQKDLYFDNKNTVLASFTWNQNGIVLKGQFWISNSIYASSWEVVESSWVLFPAWWYTFQVVSEENNIISETNIFLTETSEYLGVTFPYIPTENWKEYKIQVLWILPVIKDWEFQSIDSIDYFIPTSNLFFRNTPIG